MARGILVGARQIRNLPAPAIVRPHIVLPRAWRLLPCVTRTHTMNTFSAAVTSGKEWMISRISFFPNEGGLTDWTFLFDNWITKLDGSSQPETDNANVIRVYAAVERSGLFFPVTFDGEAYADIQPGDTVIGRALTFEPPDTTQCRIRTISRVNIGETRPVGYTRNSTLSEAAQWSANDQTALLAAGSMSNTASGLYYGPSEIRARGTSLPVGLIFDNSIGFGEDETISLADARGNISAWCRALDDSDSGQWAYSQQSTQGVRGTNMSQVGLGYRKRMLRRLQMCDRHSFDAAFGFGNENDSGAADTADWLAKTQAWVDMVRAQFDCPVYVRTMLPKATAGANSAFTDTDNQTPTSEAATREAVNESIRNGGLNGVAGYFDWGAEVADDTNPQKWKVRSYSGTLQADFTGTSCSLDVAPERGELLVFGAGASGYERSTVTAVSGSGPYTCTLNVSISTQRTSGSTVKAAPNDGDGTHPTTAVHIDVSENAIIPEKDMLS